MLETVVASSDSAAINSSKFNISSILECISSKEDELP
jgi:hypothetical protein